MFARTLSSGVLRSAATQAQRRTFFQYGNMGISVLRIKDNPHFHNDPGHDTDVWKQDDFYAPTKTNGAMTKSSDPNKVPDAMEQAVGKERIELQAMLEGRDPYHGLMDAPKFLKKGTRADPTIIDSPDEDRVIGCQGYEGHAHQPTFFVLTEDGHKYWQFGHNRCPECGNTFKLRRIQLPYHSVN